MLRIGNSEYCTVTEAAKLLEINASLVRRYIREERIPAMKVGKTWMLAISEVKKFEKKPRPRGNPEWVN